MQRGFRYNESYMRKLSDQVSPHVMLQNVVTSELADSEAASVQV